MAKKGKISIRKVLQAFVTMVVTTACIVAILGASRMQRARTVKDVQIQLNSPSKFGFLNKEEVYKDLVTDLGIRRGRTTLAKLNVSAIEKKAYRNPWVGKAQAYLDNQSVLHMQLTPRRPAARVFFENGESFYIDSTLRLLPLSEMNTYSTIIATGMPVTKNDSINKSLRAKTLKLVRFIEKDTFWSAQIDQVAITQDGDFELMPVLGTHKILLGDTATLDKKFSRLFAFYKNVLNRIGWNKYETLDLRYDNQVVAAPSLPWKMPAKNALSNMDWLNSVMEEGRKDSLKKAGVITLAPKTDTVRKAKPVVTAQITPVKKAPVVTAKASPAPKPKPKPAAVAAPPRPKPKPVAAKKEEPKTEKKQQAKYIYQSNH